MVVQMVMVETAHRETRQIVLAYLADGRWHKHLHLTHDLADMVVDKTTLNEVLADLRAGDEVEVENFRPSKVWHYRLKRAHERNARR